MFSSGMDTADLGALAADPTQAARVPRRDPRDLEPLEDMAKPTIAQIHGACLGGAAELALACDMRVMAADAVIGLVETRVGLIPDVGGCSRLPALVGLGRAKELIMASKVIDGTEAERIGLVNRVAAAAQLDAATAQLAGELLACAPLAVGLAKGVLERRRAARAGGDARAGGRRAGAVRDERRLPRGRAGVRREARAASSAAAEAAAVAARGAPDMLAAPLPEPVSIIGASGALGFGLAVRLARAGCAVTIGSRDAERAEQAAVRARELVPDSLVAGLPNAVAAARNELVILSRAVSQPVRDARTTCATCCGPASS